MYVALAFIALLLCALSTSAVLATQTALGFRGITTSPLVIALRNAQDPSVVVASIRNRGLQTLYLSTYRTIVSDDITHRLSLVADNEQPAHTFLAEGYPVYEADPPEEVLEIESGATITRHVDVVDSYDTVANATYVIRAEGSLPYRLSPSGSWTGTAAYQAEPLKYTAGRSNGWHRIDHDSAHTHDRHVFKGCDDAQFSAQVKRAVDSTAAYTKTIADKIRQGQGKDAFMAYFKSNDEATRREVANRYMAMYTTLSGKDSKSIISCRSSCTGYLSMGAAWTGPADGSTFFCPAMKTTAEKSSKCMRMVWPGVVMHELSHNAKLFRPGTLDTAQGAAASKRLTTAKALKNADTFNMFGQSIYLNTVC